MYDCYTPQSNVTKIMKTLKHFFHIAEKGRKKRLQIYKDTTPTSSISSNLQMCQNFQKYFSPILLPKSHKDRIPESTVLVSYCSAIEKYYHRFSRLNQKIPVPNLQINCLDTELKRRQKSFTYTVHIQKLILTQKHILQIIAYCQK